MGAKPAPRITFGCHKSTPPPKIDANCDHANMAASLSV